MDLRFLFSTKVQKEEGRKEEKKGQDRKERRRNRKGEADVATDL